MYSNLIFLLSILFFFYLAPFIFRWFYCYCLSLSLSLSVYASVSQFRSWMALQMEYVLIENTQGNNNNKNDHKNNNNKLHRIEIYTEFSKLLQTARTEREYCRRRPMELKLSLMTDIYIWLCSSGGPYLAIGMLSRIEWTKKYNRNLTIWLAQW